MKNKKILFIANKVPNYRVPLFNELSKKIDLTFLLTHEEKKIKGLNVKYKLLSGVGKGKFKIHFSILKELKKEKYPHVVLLPPDPLHLIDNLLTYFYLKKNKIPFTFYVGRWEYKNKPLKQKLTEGIHRKMLRNTKSCVCYGSLSKDWLLSLGVKEKDIFISYNINPEIYKNFKERRKKLPEFKNKKVVLYVGRLIKRKGVDYLIKSFSEIKDKDALLVIIGGGDFYKLGAKSEEAKLKRLVKNLGIEKRVMFTGALSPKETKEYYKSADIFVCPSITLDVGEAWGHVIEESMSFGLPVVATGAVGAAYDLIEEGKNGFIIPERNSEELKKTIQKLLKDKKLRDNMGNESKRIIQQDKFSFESIVDKWIGGLR